MAATITATGTFTGLATNLAPMRDLAQTDSEMSALSIAPADLVTPPDEIRQMIAVFQSGWGNQIAPGARLNYWTTVCLLRAMLTSYTNFGVTRRGP